MNDALGLQLTRAQRALVAGGLLGAVVVGAGAVLDPLLVVAGALAIGLILFAALRPAWAACFLLGVTPLIAGFGRGAGIPLLRPYEAVGLLVGIGVLLRLLVVGRDPSIRFERIDVAILLMALSSSIYPLLMMEVRGRQIHQADLLYAFQLWKYYGVFLIMRFSIRTRAQVRAALITAVIAAVIVGLIAALQSLRIAGVDGLIQQVFPPDSQNASAASQGRGTSTVGSSIGAADVTTYAFAVASAWILTVRNRPWWMPLAALALVVGTLGSGQFSGFIGIAVAALALGVVTRRLGRFALAFAPAAMLGIALLKPVIDTRLRPLEQGTLPQSWQVRLDNLHAFFWPVLGKDYNWLTGVQPEARVLAPPNWPSGQFVYIESGQTWLLWSGGVLFLLAFYWFVWVALRRFWEIARSRADEISVAASAAFVAVAIIAVLMFTDPHLSYRASSDMSFSLMGIAVGGATWQASRVRAGP